MLCIHPVDLDEVSPNAAFAAARVRRIAARRAIAVLRSMLVPSVLTPAILLAFGCTALLTLTGNGPRSWQAELCADGALNVTSCRGLPVASAPFGPSVVRAGAR